MIRLGNSGDFSIICVPIGSLFRDICVIVPIGSPTSDCMILWLPCFTVWIENLY